MCLHSAAGVCVAVGVVPNTHTQYWGPGQATWGQLKAQWQKRWPWLSIGCPLAVSSPSRCMHCTAVEADDRNQAGVTQGKSWSS